MHCSSSIAGTSIRITRSWAGCLDCMVVSGLSPDGEVFLLTSPFIDRYLGQVNFNRSRRVFNLRLSGITSLGRHSMQACRSKQTQHSMLSSSWCDYGLIRSLGIHLPANMKKVRGSCVKLFPLSKIVMSIHGADCSGDKLFKCCSSSATSPSLGFGTRRRRDRIPNPQSHELWRAGIR